MSLSRYQLERADLITVIEQGRRVEREQFQENTRNPLSTMGELFRQRRFEARNAALREQRRQLHQAGKVIQAATFVEHGVMCLCDDCEAAVKRLLQDVGVLPNRKGAKR